MAQRPKRETVDLSQYPDLVVIYLGMRVNTVTGFKTLLGFGPDISSSVQAQPDGLLLHENLMSSLRHFGMRQYWRDFESPEAWARSDPHRAWWQKFLRDSGGTGFWHETYLRSGGMESVYVDMRITGRDDALCAHGTDARTAVRSAYPRWAERPTPAGAVPEQELY